MLRKRHLAVLLGLTAVLTLAYLHRGQRQPVPKITAVAAAAPDPSIERYKVQLGDAPVLGPPTAKLTLVEYTDYQCPFCSLVEPTLDQLRGLYGEEVRLALKHNPTPIHPRALPAARAARAALEQGEERFWAFHRQLLHHQQQFDDAGLLELARGAGLDTSRFQNDLQRNQARYDARIQAEQAEATRLGARITPTFFINGRRLEGAQPLAAFKMILDQELRTADRSLKAGASREQLYATLIQNGKEQAPAPATQAPALVLPDARVRYLVPLGQAPARGPQAALVTVAEYADFQCPFSAQAQTPLRKVLLAHPDAVRLVFKQSPLPVHPQAHLAAEAALAAGEQGKFWEMHDLLFQPQQTLDRQALDKYAAQLGLDPSRFAQALDSGRFRQQVDAERAEAEQLGARGTPTFFINGRPLTGAQSAEVFEARLAEALREAEALQQQRHLPPGHIYEELMKDAQAQVAGR